MSFVRAKKRGGRTYYYLVEGVREGDKVRQRVLRYLGTAEDLEREKRASAPIVEPVSVESSVQYGAVAALHALSDEIGLGDVVRTAIKKGGGPDIGKLFELMVINRCIEPASRHRLPQWYAKSALPRLLNLPTDRMSEDVLYNALGYFTDERITRAQQDMWIKLKAHGADTSRVFYDLTSTYFEGHALSIAKHGYSRDHRGDKVQVNIAVAVNRQGFPITHKVLEGNVADVTTVQDANATLRTKFLVTDAIMVLDRGMMSDENRTSLLNSKTPYIAGVRMTPALQRFIASRPTSKFTQASPDDERYFVHDAQRENRRLVIVWNKAKQEDDYEWRMNALTRAEKSLGELHEKTGIPSVRTKSQLLTKARAIIKKQGVAPFLTLKVNERGPPRLSWTRNAAKLRWEARWDGRFALETNTSLPVEEVFWAYHERDVVEKFLQAIKGIVELRPVHVYNETHVKAHVFVCVTSVLLLQLLREKLKKAGIPLSSVSALEHLEGVMEVVVKHGDELHRVLSRRDDDQARLLGIAGAPVAL